jgi:hypothetical protein
MTGVSLQVLKYLLAKNAEPSELLRQIDELSNSTEPQFDAARKFISGLPDLNADRRTMEMLQHLESIRDRVKIRPK